MSDQNLFERFAKAGTATVTRLIAKVEAAETPEKRDMWLGALAWAGEAPGDAGKVAQRAFNRLVVGPPVKNDVVMGDVVRISKANAEAVLNHEQLQDLVDLVHSGGYDAAARAAVDVRQGPAAADRGARCRAPVLGSDANASAGDRRRPL